MSLDEAADICREADKIAKRMGQRFVLDARKLEWSGFSEKEIDELEITVPE